MNTYVIPCLAALAACFGFSLLYHIRGKNLLFASLCGAFAWAVYLLASNCFALGILSYLLAGAAAALYSEAAAFVLKSPVTVFLIPGIIPTVPGLAIYRTMENCLLGNVDGFLNSGIEAMKIGGAIALGLILASSLCRLSRAGIQRAKTYRERKKTQYTSPPL